MISAVPCPPVNQLSVAFFMHDLSGGGVERMRLSLIDALRKRNICTTLIVSNRRGSLSPLVPPDLPVVELRIGRTLSAVTKLIAFLKQARPDVLVSSLDHNNIVAMIACACSGVPTRLVICQHTALSAEHGMGWKYRLVPWAYWLLQGTADGIVAVSRGVADDLVATAGIARKRISTIYNPVIGADFDKRQEGSAPHPWLRHDTCYAHMRPVFVFAGRLTAQKDPGTLLAALKLFMEHRPARLIVLGEGEQEGDLRRLARERNLDDAVHFAGFQANPLPWIRHADALVSSSRYEGLGNTIVEALACGTPVIATDCPHGPAEILLQGELGRLVPVGDAAALAKAMYDQLDSEVDRARLKARAADFTAEACAEAHLALFRRIGAGGSTTVHALGIRFAPMTTEHVAELVLGAAPTGPVSLIVTANINHVRLLRCRDFADSYSFARFACPDGFPVLVYARLRGLPLKQRVTGCDIFEKLMHHRRLRGQRLFFVVECAETASAANAWFDTRGMGQQVRVAVAPSGLLGNDAAQASLARMIAEESPTLLVMTLGAPVSEIFVYRHRDVLPPCWALCVGQALRVELGLVRRAPMALRKLGLEWLWRMFQEPRRLVWRYVQDVIWFPIAILLDLSHRVRPDECDGPLGRDIRKEMPSIGLVP
jgi:exopolysaccharide biosynthesis WecB/TagA/CpsF family protein